MLVFDTNVLIHAADEHSNLGFLDGEVTIEFADEFNVTEEEFLGGA